MFNQTDIKPTGSDGGGEEVNTKEEQGTKATKDAGEKTGVVRPRDGRGWEG
jgi:hypothetical protein